MQMRNGWDVCTHRTLTHNQQQPAWETSLLSVVNSPENQPAVSQSRRKPDCRL